MIKQPAVLVGVCITSGAIGFIVGYKAAERRLIAEFDERLIKETAGMREFYTATKKPYATPQEAAAKLIVDKEADEVAVATQTAYHKIVVKEKYTPDPAEVQAQMNAVVDFGDQDEVAVNIFSTDDRDIGKPYVISQEEFMENAPGWQQVTLTYYRGDNALVDEREDMIENREKVIGLECLDLFGQHSSDPNVVHVRNEQLGLDFEVVLHETSYAEEVLGADGPAPDLPSGRARKDP